MIKDFKNFTNIYIYNSKYKKEDKEHKKALLLQLYILVFVIVVAIINTLTFDKNNIYFQINEYNAIYAILIGFLSTILVAINSNGIDRKGKLLEMKYNYTNVTYKQDYVSLIMYSIFLLFIGMFSCIFYEIFLQYLDYDLINIIFWIFYTFILLDALFFTMYTLLKLSYIFKNSY